MLSPRRETLLDGISHCGELRQLSLSGEGVEDVDFLSASNLARLTLQLASAEIYPGFHWRLDCKSARQRSTRRGDSSRLINEPPRSNHRDQKRLKPAKSDH